ncbi:hypothetical protein LCGC14_0187830 [marine sediment metagenome]
MNKLVTNALAYLEEHWHVGMTGTADAAHILNINPNTMKTRLARGQALVLRDPNGGQRQALVFTGFHMVYNLLQDRLLRYGFPVEHDERSMGELPYTYAEWALKNVVVGHKVDAVVRFRREPEGGTQAMPFEDGAVEDWTGDAALIIPIGTMIVRMAMLLHMRSGEVDIARELAGR